MTSESSTGRRYRVLSLIGRGGFGNVYRADLVGPGGFTKIVALKVLHPDISGASDIARRLRDEGRMLGLVRHPAIVNADGLVLLRGRWTIVMEYVEGAMLKSLLTGGPLPARVSFAICEAIAEALDFAYLAPGPDGAPLRLLHRDIKPSNVKITPRGEVKLLDFGFARADFHTREADSSHQLFMSVPYMAPERLEGRSTTKSDVYSLGAVLFECLTGTPLGRAYGNPERHAEHLSKSRERLAQQVRSDDIEELVLAMLAHDPVDRPELSDLARRSGALVAELRGPLLRAWAMARVPPVASQEGMETEDDQDELVGKVLREQPGSESRWEDLALVEASSTAEGFSVPSELKRLAPEPPDRRALTTERPPTEPLPPPGDPDRRMALATAIGVGIGLGVGLSVALLVLLLVT